MTLTATTKGKLAEIMSDLSHMITRTANEGDIALARDLDAVLSALRRVYWLHHPTNQREPKS